MLSSYMVIPLLQEQRAGTKNARGMMAFSHSAIFKMSYLMSFKWLSRAGHFKAAVTNQCKEQVLVIHCVTI